jgi:hexosaminidase
VIGGIGNFTNPFAAASYYTQADIEEIVRYAAERFIDIIPRLTCQVMQRRQYGLSGI